jgi:hypothetical protein
LTLNQRSEDELPSSAQEICYNLGLGNQQKEVIIPRLDLSKRDAHIQTSFQNFDALLGKN